MNKTSKNEQEKKNKKRRMRKEGWEKKMCECRVNDYLNLKLLSLISQLYKLWTNINRVINHSIYKPKCWII